MLSETLNYIDATVHRDERVVLAILICRTFEKREDSYYKPPSDGFELTAGHYRFDYAISAFEVAQSFALSTNHEHIYKLAAALCEFSWNDANDWARKVLKKYTSLWDDDADALRRDNRPRWTAYWIHQQLLKQSTPQGYPQLGT